MTADPIRLSRAIALSVGAAESDPLPSEFRIFRAGVNDSTKGPVIFDDEAARLVMEEYARQGNDLMVDLEHAVVEARHTREDSLDARGWFNLEVRGGELWAVNVTWAPDGEKRLREKRQRYVSPLFKTQSAKDSGGERVSEILNVALVSMPATYNAQELIAASRRGELILTPAQRAKAYLLGERCAALLPRRQ